MKESSMSFEQTEIEQDWSRSRSALGSRVSALWKQGWPILLLACLVGIFFWRLILLGEVFVPADILNTLYPWRVYTIRDFSLYSTWASDIINSQYPARAVALHALRSGQFPMWDPYTSSGRPLGILPNYALIFPLNILLLFLPLDIGFSYAAAARILLAGAATYGFLRQLKLGRISALVGGIVFAFNGFLIVWMNATAGVTISALPLIFWSGDLLFRKPSAKYVALLAVSLAVLISGGFLAIVIFGLYVLGGYWLFRAVLEIRRSGNWQQVARRLFLCGISVLIGLLLMTPELASFWSHLRLTEYDASRAGRRLTVDHWSTLIRYLIPHYYGSPEYRPRYDTYPERTAYGGVFTLVAAAIGILFTRRRSVAKYFGFVALASFCAVYILPIKKIIVLLPMLRIASLRRAKSILVFSVAILAAFGIDFLYRRWDPVEGKRQWVMVIVVLAALIQLAIFGATEWYWHSDASSAAAFEGGLWELWSEERFHHPLFEYTLLWLLWLLSGVGLVVARAKNFISRRAVAWGAVILISLDILGWGMTYWKPVERSQVYPSTPGIELLQRESGLFRVTGLNGALFPNGAGVYQLQDIAGHDPLALDRYRAILAKIDSKARFGVHGTILMLHAETANLDSPLLDLLSVKFVATRPRSPGQEPRIQSNGFNLVYEGPDMDIYQNVDPMPRSYVLFDSDVVSDPSCMVDQLDSGLLDLREVVLLERDPPSGFPSGEESEVVTGPHVTKYTANHVVVEVEVNDPAFLVLTDIYYPGWDARIDGEWVEVYRANYLFRAVFLPPGSHQVEFVFRPRPFCWGQALRLVLLFIMGSLVAWEWWRHRHRGR
jgi:hypothetical protein